MNATLAQRMPPTTVENPTTEETVSAALSAGVGAAVSVSVASNLAASAEGDPQDPEKIQQRKQQQALTRMWKIRDAMIRRTIVKKRRLHVQALADARRRAELENAVLDERHARLMLQVRICVGITSHSILSSALHSVPALFTRGASTWINPTTPPAPPARPSRRTTSDASPTNPSATPGAPSSRRP